MDFDITVLLVFAVGLIFGMLTKFAPYVSNWIGQLRGQLPADWDWLTDEIIDTGVKAAQQVYKEQDGPAKLAYAKDFIYAVLKQRGIKYDEAQIVAMIEAKVFELFKQYKVNEYKPE